MKKIALSLILLLLATAAHALTSASVPAKFNIPWANAAAGAYVRTIPQASQIGIQDCAASLTDGYPPKTFQPVSAGGCGPFGQDMNGILKQITQWNQWQAAGGPLYYDATFSTGIGGYPSGATVQATARAGCFWTSTADNNTSNPDSGGANWISSCSLVCYSYTHDFGAVAGGTDNSAALATAINTITAAGGGCMTIPAGKFTHNSPVTPSTFPNSAISVVIRGSGRDASVLTWPNAGNGLTLNLQNPANSLSISDLSITTGSTNPGVGVGLAINQSSCVGTYSRNSFRNLSVRGDDNLLINYWSQAVAITGLAGSVWDNVEILGANTPAGIGMTIQGTAAGGGCYALDHVVTNSVFNGSVTAFQAGSYTQGVSLVHSKWGGTNCILIPSSLSGQLGRLAVDGNEFNCGGTSIDINSIFNPILVSQNVIYSQASQSGIKYNIAGTASFIGNSFLTPSLSGNTGITVSATALGAVISGNNFNSLANGIFLTNGSTFINVQSNYYAGNTCGVFRGSTSSCAYTNTPSTNTIGGGTP